MYRLPALLVAVSLLAPAAVAEPETMDGIFACAAISSDADRLACYDEAAGRLKTASDAGEFTTITREEVERVQKESFGLPSFSLPAIGRLAEKSGDKKLAEIEEIEAGIVSVKKNSVGQTLVTLDNGQVWRVTDTYELRAKGAKKAVVRKAALGSFKMKLDNGRTVRVARES
jgi:hypothetical protein